MRTVAPSYVAARWLQALAAMAVGAVAPRSAPTRTNADGREALSLPYSAYESPLVDSLSSTVRQFDTTAGLTQASRVMPVVRSRELASGTVTQSLTPLNDSPPPFFPATCVGPASVPVFPEPE